ncbi:uncharacterized protein LOC114187685 isoform X1 [Vigna unguiculata]|uniref:uncharacterized protein LOC114187685 isoform X1 n=1 Tax=Vigna unguiculata TaxID=3917 RepID=UPI00101632D4|nr:uncharacterized protein LOC114187685 isoform X1 [Vigna unguiculata]XP_027931793.1 uncharacterized protein LOC114187685 isoform X1 [Vigna unguiculata]
MQPQSSLLNVSVTWRGKKFVVEMNIGATVKDLGQELQKLTNINEDTMRFIVPQISGRASKLLTPFSAEHAVLSLQEASITEARSIIMMGVSTNEVEEVLQSSKTDLRIAGFEDEEKRVKQRISHGPHISLKLPQGQYIFCEFRTLQIPGLELNPPAAEALKRMHMLAADPGIVAVMNKHRWRVGIMTEMAPVGYVGVDPKCILGFNKNHGEEISLRLRTDDLKGFRKYESIKKTLLHELAHMVYSEHDANFYALDKQLNQEASSLDWTRSASRTLSGLRNTSTYEDDIIADNSSIPQKLGGDRTDQLISARESSVAAAYHRLANVSPNKLGGSELNQDLDPGYSSHSLSEKKSDCMISASKEIEDIQMAVTDNKEHRGEPDPDDHIINGMNHEPDPDDSHHGKAVDYDVSSGIADSKTFEQPNDFGVRQVLQSETSTGNMVAKYASLANQDTSEASTESIAPIIETVLNDVVPTPELSTLQTSEPDPDDQEFQRINDTSTAVCNRLLKAVEMLRREVSATQATSILQTLLKIIRNVIEHPLVEKYKRLRKANPVIERNILNNKAALEILFLVGFSEDVMFDNLGKEDAYLVLKKNDPGLLWLAKSTLESSTGLAC